MEKLIILYISYFVVFGDRIMSGMAEM